MIKKKKAAIIEWIRNIEVSQSSAILITALFIAVFDNKTFFKHIAVAYPGQILFQLSVFVVFLSLLIVTLNFLAHSKAFKPILIGILILGSLQAYVTDSFGVVSDRAMIINILNTDPSEVFDLVTFEALVFFIFLGILPSMFILFLRIKRTSSKITYKAKARDVTVSLLVLLLMMFTYNKTYASFLREQKPLRYYTNPTFFIYSATRVIDDFINSKKAQHALAEVGEDAKIPAADTERELIIFVLGETARSDRFSLNGYTKETNPLLKKEEVLSFTDVYSCGTSTATSVPCMFSIFGRAGFDHEDAEQSENLVDVLKDMGRINVLWRDNNSDSKGVAVRVPYEDFRSPKINTLCDSECRDEGMLIGLQEYIDKKTEGDIFIVLHQMGNHGPAYFKRYPESFEFFKPACKSYDLGNCSGDEINNAYDNAIRYTDYFLSKVIQLLKRNDARFETAMFYVSDHGESLGEGGIYLHGLPYSIAPVEQRKVPLIFWFGNTIKDDINLPAVKAKLGSKFTHDNVFHTILRLMEIETGIYDESKDILEYNYDY